jgi:hypothetical protein
MKGDRRAEADGGTFPGRARRTPARIELSLLSRAFSPHKAPPDIARRALCCATASSSCAFGWQAESENETDKVKRAPFNQVIKPQIRPRSIAEHTVRVARNATQAGLRGRTFTHQQDSAHRARRVDEPAAAPCARGQPRLLDIGEAQACRLEADRPGVRPLQGTYSHAPTPSNTAFARAFIFKLAILATTLVLVASSSMRCAQTRRNIEDSSTKRACLHCAPQEHPLTAPDPQNSL